ncbi:GNAT family N-acetyltransferase [Nocardia huaxiensis]|uniref:GNAT family N-acetyltransferase n=1 Tax=Nocardia huaxiensis TaxID=2755382 RepID=A0A7D6ZDC0_9NOCA|nr:GNAT family N-acetyltransferase [Nocardia huaxiensis]QLY28219.1 GNAT family N-acetyltransferase [Nocardia huaxiensis]UFS98345.1 GNAT family N-acetyltransferase [Nocardia huaxiensis]
MNNSTEPGSDVTLRRVTAETVYEVCKLSESLPVEQRKLVVDNGISMAQAHFTDAAWFRGVYCGEQPVGFLMLDLAMDSDQPGVSLWRFMIAGPHQGKGVGRRAIDILVTQLKARGTTALYVSYRRGPASAEGFYRSLGFQPTGRTIDGEAEAILSW